MAGKSNNPFDALGYTLNHLARDGSGVVCSKDTAQGAPLLALPLARCWTAEAAEQECPVVAKVVSEALARNPGSPLLRSEATWIVLHLLQVRRAPQDAPVERREHFALLPEKLETLLAWSDQDLMALAGSPLKMEVKRRLNNMRKDFETLSTELGPHGVTALGLAWEGYLWGCQVVQQFGLQILKGDGSVTTLIVPGLELMEPDTDSVPIGSEGARLEGGFTKGEQQTLTFYSGRSVEVGERVSISHGGLACSNGARLFRCGVLAESNPHDSVEIDVTFPVDGLETTGKQFDNLLSSLGQCRQVPRSYRAGDCMSADHFQSRETVELVHVAGIKSLRVAIRLTKEMPLPGHAALAALGLGLTISNNGQDELQTSEKKLADVYGDRVCNQRALEFLKPELDKALSLYVEPKLEKASQSRAARAQQVVVSEKEIISQALQALSEQLAADVARPHAVEDLSKGDGGRTVIEELMSSGGALPEPSTALGRAVSQLKGCSQALELIAGRFLTMTEHGEFSQADGAALSAELDVIKGTLKHGPLGDPLDVPCAPLRESQHTVVQEHVNTAVALLSTILTAKEWEQARLEKEGGSKKALVPILMEIAALRMRLSEFEDAQQELRRATDFAPGASKPSLAALDCAMVITAASEEVLAASKATWSNYTSGLKALRERLKNLGYTKAGLRWTAPPRVPVVANFAKQAWAWGADAVDKEIEEHVLGIKADAGPKVKKHGEKRAAELRDLISLFARRSTIKLGRVVKLLGEEACKMLLELRALTCYQASGAKLFEPAEAKGCVGDAGFELLCDVYANVLLWPVEDELLVAFDFDQVLQVEGKYDPVPYVSHDTLALLASAPRTNQAAKVLDACCGSGAQGLVAMKHYAERVIFMDSNPRALRFACFSSHLNGLGEHATFVDGSLCDSEVPSELKGSKFNAILANLPFLPNPHHVVTNGGPLFDRGGTDGEAVLSEVVAKAARELLAPGGHLVATSFAPNAEVLAERVAGWADGDAARTDFRAVIFRGGPMSSSDYVSLAAVSSPAVAVSAHMQGLREAGIVTMSQVVLLLCLPPKGAGPAASARADTRMARAGLWDDVEYLRNEVPAEVDHLIGARVVELMDKGGDSIYAMDWGDAQEDGDNAVAILPVGERHAFTPAPRSLRWRDLRKKGETNKGQPVKPCTEVMTNGATWRDLAALRVLGFCTPSLCNLQWRKTPTPLEEDRRPFPPTKFRMSVVEVMGCRIPGVLRNALRLMGSRGKIFCSGTPRQIGSATNPNEPLAGIDTLIIPLITEDKGKRPQLYELPWEFFNLRNQLMMYVAETHYICRVVVLTCRATGPNDGVGDQGPPPAASIRGMLRCTRTEIQEEPMPICHIDTDLFEGTDGHALAAQIIGELEHMTPQKGFEAAKEQEKSEAIFALHREVIYRKGQRFVPELDVSSRNPILAGSNLDHLKVSKFTSEGVCIITGGTGGLGILSAVALAQCGMKKFVLASRSGRMTRDNQGLGRYLDELRALGAEVVFEACDSGKEAQVVAMLDRVRERDGPIRIICHAAGISAESTPENIEPLFGPKAEGAWYMHKHTLQDSLTGFLVYSSMSCVHGAAGMSCYAAACTYIDELVTYRKAKGLPGVSVTFPEVEGAGMAADMTQVGSQANIGPEHTKHLIKQVFCGVGECAPVQVCMPKGNLIPLGPFYGQMLAPLNARRDMKLTKELAKEEERLGKKAVKELRAKYE